MYLMTTMIQVILVRHVSSPCSVVTLIATQPFGGYQTELKCTYGGTEHVFYEIHGSSLADGADFFQLPQENDLFQSLFLSFAFILRLPRASSID